MASAEAEYLWNKQIQDAAKAASDRESAWAKSQAAEASAREQSWNYVLEDGGGPGMHETGSYYDPVKGRTVRQYAVGDANTSFWGKAGGVLSDIAGAVGSIIPGGSALTSLIPGANDLSNSIKSTGAYKTGSALFDTGKNVYAQFAPKNTGAVTRPSSGPTPIQNLPSNLVQPSIAVGGPAPVNNFSNPSQSYIEKNYGMALLGAGLVVMFFMFKKGRK